ncbi:MAG: Transporter, superfamily [Gammaproteobacteria bacterium]|jgi:MFS family permease|nr:Transporter, superfamily [Gammaproteobacteria bacterium]
MVMIAKTHPKQPHELRSWLVCLSAASFFLYEFIQMLCLNSMNSDVRADFHISATELGWLSSVYFISNVLFLFPAGQLIDRYSVKRLILIFMALCITGTVLFSQTTDFGLALFFRFITGIGSAFCFLCSMRLASRWFLPHRMALISGSIVTMAMLGGWIAQAPFAALVSLVGWRHALLFDAAFGVLLWLSILLIVREYPPEELRTYESDHNQLHRLGWLNSMKKAYGRKQNWLCGIYTDFMNLPIFLLGGLWGGLYLMQIQHLPKTMATHVAGMLFFGTIIGAPLVGYISDKLSSRKLPMWIGAIVSLMLILMLIYLQLDATTLSVIFFLLGLSTSTQVLSYPTVTESNPHALTAMSVSVVSFCVISGGAMFEPLFGWLMDLKWSHTITNGLSVYSNTDLYRGLLIMPVAFILAGLMLFGIRETFCKMFNEEKA